jgi:integrase
MAHESIKHLHSILHRALSYAVSQDLLKTNPASNAKLPSKAVAGPDENTDVVECLTLEQARRFRETARSDRFGPLWILLLDTGIRPGEAFALQWKHIDFEKGRVTVKQSLTCTYTAEERQQAGHGWRVKVTKTKRSVRSVPVSKATLEMLRHWRAQQAKQRIQLGADWRDHQFVFTKPNGEPLGANMDRAWMQVMRAADGGRGDLGQWGPATKKPVHGAQAERKFTPKFSMYTCRHTFATLLYENGVSIEDIARLLGNTPGICAKHYVRREREPSTQGVDVLTRLFEPGLKLA